MIDFTIQIYKKLLITLQKQGFNFFLYKDFPNYNENQKQLVLRHDVDARKENSWNFAKIQYKMGIVGTYYFRIMPQSFDEKIIKEIAGLGHEIGYHYETMATVSKKISVKDYNVLIDAAFEEFCRNLETFRKICSIETICMHGSPFSKYDNKAIWEKYDYKKLGIISEPYLDTNFKDVLYLTDTGRRWNGDSVSIRDKAIGERWQATENQTVERGGEGEMWIKEQKTSTPGTQHAATFPRLHATFDIIKSAEEGRLPEKIMMTFHPQRWTDKPVPWAKELVWQNVKNAGKYFLVKIRQ